MQLNFPVHVELIEAGPGFENMEDLFYFFCDRAPVCYNCPCRYQDHNGAEKCMEVFEKDPEKYLNMIGWKIV